MDITPQENELLLEVAAMFDYPAYDPKRHILRKQMTEVWGVSNNGAGYRLDKLVSDGKLEVEKVRLPDGNLCNGYYKPE
jgi:hypothetical protein